MVLKGIRKFKNSRSDMTIKRHIYANRIFSESLEENIFSHEITKKNGARKELPYFSSALMMSYILFL